MPRRLSDEEKKLWRHVTRHDEPLSSQAKPEAAAWPKPEKPEAKKEASFTLDRLVASKAPVRKMPAPISLSNYANIDKNTAMRFRKGNYPFDATLDLHGMTAEKAHAALKRFIAAHHAKQSRCLLIITGKGKAGEGVPKRALPGWLAGDDLASMILAVDTAKAKHGGSGAYYVLLRRKR